jgi:tetratricopeptide (TPR) repeat protein
MAAAVAGLMAQPKPKSNAEADAVRALFAAKGQSPDATIKAADDLLFKFADTAYKEVALLLEADAYQQKGDYASAEVTDERLLESYPKNPQAGMQLAELIVQHVRENDLDKEEQLAKAEKRINDALANIDTKPWAGVPDATWEENKKYVKAELQNDLGLVAMTRKNYDVAIADFKVAIQGDPQDAYQVRLASAYLQSGKNDDALAVCDKLLANPQLHPTIRKLAEDIKAKAAKAKGAGAK